MGRLYVGRKKNVVETPIRQKRLLLSKLLLNVTTIGPALRPAPPRLDEIDLSRRKKKKKTDLGISSEESLSPTRLDLLLTILLMYLIVR